MPRPVLLAPLLAACLLPAGSEAQSSSAIESTSGPPYAPITLTTEDLGSWDVELTGRGPFGARVTVRGIETNTVGCNGSCIVTRVEGELAKASQRSSGRSPWWRDGDAGPHSLTQKQTGLRDTPSAGSSEIGRDPVAPTRPVPAAALRPQASRTQVEHPDAKRRVVTVFGADGSTVQTRIVYTRRVQP
jgi:hypothetical protein